MKTLILFLALYSVMAFASDTPYQGLEVREIKSLSESDIDSLKKGSGWGLAKPAELNGVPGPAHLLELKEELQLNQSQVEKIQAIRQEMNVSAKRYGESYILAEQAIENFFREEHQEPKQLASLLKQSAQHLAELREAHLIAHLKVKPLLTRHQIVQYSQLRGYATQPQQH